jgi:hypothetical protein
MSFDALHNAPSFHSSDALPRLKTCSQTAKKYLGRVIYELCIETDRMQGNVPIVFSVRRGDTHGAMLQDRCCSARRAHRSLKEAYLIRCVRANGYWRNVHTPNSVLWIHELAGSRQVEGKPSCEGATYGLIFRRGRVLRVLGYTTRDVTYGDVLAD